MFCRTVESVNVIIASNQDEELMGDIQIGPEKGTVAFGSGLQGWGFTLTKFANMYAKKFGTEPDKMMAKLWGDWFFDAKAKKWKKSETADDGSTLKRAFCQFILDPLVKLFANIMSDKKEAVFKMIAALGVTLEKEEKELTDKKLLKIIMQKWLNAADALLEMIVLKLPSPKTAQK